VVTAVNDFVVGCKADGIWDDIYHCCILYGARTKAGALVPLRGPAPTSNGTEGGWTYSRTGGLAGNGTDNYLDTTVLGDTFSQGDIHVAGYAVSGIQIIGNTAAGDGTHYCDTQASKLRSRLHGTIFDKAGLVSSGFIGGALSGTAVTVRSNGTTESLTRSPTAPLAQTLLVFARRNATTFAPESFQSGSTAAYSIGSALDLSLLDSRLTALIAAITISLTP
jgi:hypothetical protein